jgi:hypothetical protein
MTWKEMLIQKIEEFKTQYHEEPNVIFNPTLTEEEVLDMHKHLFQNDTLLLKIDQKAYSNLKAENDQRLKDTLLGFKSMNFTIFGIVVIKAAGIPNDTLANIKQNSFIIIKDKAI